MKDIKVLLKWEEMYDETKYPYEVYKELVIEGKFHPRKIEILGAWKTGCLKKSLNSGVYRDKHDKNYVFSGRWKESSPVGYKGWCYISKHQDTLKKQVPVTFTKVQPPILNDLISIQGFGFIWSIFILHCWYPKVFPLYDQHVYRAFRYIDSEYHEIPDKAQLSWDGYKAYHDFFIKSVGDFNEEFWRLDKALWAFGKHLASCKTIRKKNNVYYNEKKTSFKNGKSSREPFENISSSHTKIGKSGRVSFTLVRSKPFTWCFSETNNLIITRFFKNRQENRTKITEDELEKIDNFVTSKKDWVDLANNVEKLAKGIEKDGIGKFLYEELDKNPTEAQLSSHIAALFVKAKIWEWRKHKGSMQFRKIDVNDWPSLLKKYYKDGPIEES